MPEAAAPAAELERIGSLLAEFVYQYDTEDRLARSGLKEEPSFEPIVDRFTPLLQDETLAALRRYREELPEPDRERARRLYFYLLDSLVDDAGADVRERLAEQLGTASAEVDGEELDYFTLVDRLASEDGFDRRERLGTARDGIDEGLVPLREELLARELAALRSYGYESVIVLQSDRKRIDHHDLLARLSKLNLELSRLYRERMTELARDRLGREFSDLRSEHVAYLFRLDEFAHYFPTEAAFRMAARTFSNLGIELDQIENIHVDTADRPGKAIGPVCYPSRVPDEIHVVTPLIRGATDFRSFFHELGHAVHYGLTDPALRLELRQFGTSTALTETYAFLLENLVRKPEWQEEHLALPSGEARRLVRRQALDDLHFLRWHVARLAYELELYSHPLDTARNREFYASVFTEETGFVYHPASFLKHVDGSLRSGDYLRALLTESMLDEVLVARFGDDWFRSRHSGELLRDLWRCGESIECEDLARELGYEEWDAAPLRRRYERLLGA